MSVKYFRQAKELTLLFKLLIRLLIVIIPIYALSIYINNTSANHIKNELINSMILHNQFFISSFEDEIAHTMRLQQEFFSDTDLKKLSILSKTMNEYEKTSLILRVQEKISMINNAGTYTDSVKVYIPLLDRLITPYTISQPAATDLKSFHLATSVVGPKMISWKGKILLGNPYQVEKDTSGNPQFLVGVELSISKLMEVLSRFSDVTDGGDVYFVNIDENWIISKHGIDSEHFIINEYVKEHASLNKSDHGEIEINNKKHLIAYEYSEYLKVALVVNIPSERVLSPLEKYSNWFWLVSIIVFLMLILYSFWLYQLIHQPLYRLVRASRKVEEGNLEIQLNYKKNDEFNYLYWQFNEMVSSINSLIHENYEQKSLAQQAELKQLQAQINPHFLYNTYYVLYRMAMKHDMDSVITYTKYLGDYFKYITRNTFDDVCLIDEINHARIYTKIQSVRFYNRIEVFFDELPMEMHNIRVPRLILQPILENTYNHGFEETLQGGEINVSYIFEDDHLLISVEDNGQGMAQEKLALLRRDLQSTKIDIEVTGIINVHRRLQLRFGGESGIDVKAREANGLCILLCIPK